MTWSVLKSDTGNTDTSYAHTGLTNGDTRHYRVSGVHGNNRALLSNVASATAADPADTTPPTFLPARTVPARTYVANGGDEITLAFDEVLNDGAGRTPPASAFTVTADGSTVTVTEALVVCTVRPSWSWTGVITYGQTVTVSYRDPTPGDDPAAVQDYAGNDAASFTDQAD